MDDIEKIKHLLDMLKVSISDVSSCEDDLEFLDEDFLKRFPDYGNKNLSEKDQEMLEKIKLNYLYFRRRNYVRVVFSSIEGIIFAMKRILLDFSEKLLLSDEEIIKLQEYKFVGPSYKKLKRQPAYNKYDENIKLTFSKYALLKNKDSKTIFNSNEWENFTYCIKIRNRITHPKLGNDLIISEKEFNKVKLAHEWFSKVANELQEYPDL